jgi:hypothetical protein
MFINSFLLFYLYVLKEEDVRVFGSSANFADIIKNIFCY